MAGAGIMEIGYAIQVKPKDDPFIRYAESGLECFNAAAVFCAPIAEVSPKSVRRSEWPRMTYGIWASASCAGLVSPVYAPEGWM